MGVSGLCFSRGKYFSIFNLGRIVTVGGRVIGDGISGLFSPFCKECTGLFKGLSMLFIFDQIAKLVRILRNLKEFFGRARIGKHLLLFGPSLSGGMSFP